MDAQRAWFGWYTEYPDEGSVLFEADSEEEAMRETMERLGAETEDEVSVQRHPDALDHEIARLRGELSRAVARETIARQAAGDLYAVCAGEWDSGKWPADAKVTAVVVLNALSEDSPLSDAAQEVLEAARLTANAVRELDKGEEPTRWGFELASCQEMLLRAENRYRSLLEGQEEE